MKTKTMARLRKGEEPVIDDTDIVIDPNQLFDFGYYEDGDEFYIVLDGLEHFEVSTAFDFVEVALIPKDELQYQINSAIGLCAGRLETGALDHDAVKWLYEDIKQIFNGVKLYDNE